MKKISLALIFAGLLIQFASHAQTPATTTPLNTNVIRTGPQTAPLNTNVVKTGAQALPTAEQLTQEMAGFIYACATTKPLLGWKSITVSLDKTQGGQMNVLGYATMGNNSIKKIELCNRQDTAQALIDMLNITTKGKTVEWESLLFRTKPDRQFEFWPLTVADVLKISEATKTTAAKP